MKRSQTFVEAFTNILVQQKAIKPDEAAALKKGFFSRSQEAFDDFLIEEGLLSRTAILNGLSQYYDVPAFDVLGYFFDHQLLREFPKDFLLRNQILPLERDENILFVIASNPNDSELLARIGEFVSYDIQFMVGIGPDITQAVKEFYDVAPTHVAVDEDLRQERQEERDAGELFLDEE